MPTSNQIPIEELNNILEANQEISPGMKNALDNLKEEYNQAYKSLMIYPDQEIPDEFVEELLGAREKLMDYNYLSDEERQYHQDILEGVKKMNKRLQEDPTFTIERSDAAKGGLIKRVKLRGGKDAAQSDFGSSDFGGYDSGGYDPAPAPTSSKVTEINIGDAPTVFDINKVGDPSQNLKSINVTGDDRFSGYTPSFATPPSFFDKAISKGKSFVKFVSPFLVNAAFGTFVPSKVKKGIALFNLAKNIDTIQDITTQDVLEEDMAIAPDGREEFRFGSRGYQGSKASPVDRGPSARDRAMGSGGKRKGGTNTRPSGEGNNKTKTNKPTIVDKGKAILNVPLQFGKGLFGNVKNPGANVQVGLTKAQKARLNEIIQSKGTSTGTINYTDYGSDTPTFSGVKNMSPIDASLATTFGGGSFSIDPKGNVTIGGGTYDFGSGSNNPITNFINEGGFTGSKLGKGIYNLGGKLAEIRSGAKDGGEPKKIPIRSNKYGVKELDYRKSGGFVPIGVKEKADDVPAMLSKNEFVFTADAVRGAGNGSINKGAQKMYNLMKNLEARRV